MKLAATLQDNSPGLLVEVPNEAVESLGGGKRPAVIVSINGMELRTRIAVYGGRSLIGLSKAFRAEHELQPGELVDVIVELDETPREVEVPDDLVQVLAADPEAQAAFDRLSFTNRKEYAAWIESAKRADTRRRRLLDAPGLLKAGRKTPL